MTHQIVDVSALFGFLFTMALLFTLATAIVSFSVWKDSRVVVITQQSAITVLPTERIYSVILEGPSDSGKSSLLRKMVDPSASFSSNTPPANPVAKRTEHWPIAWQKASDKGELLCLKFIDIAGERPEQVSNSIASLTPRLGLLEYGIIISVIASDKLDEALKDRLGRNYLLSSFGNEQARSRIKGAIVYVNKMDIIPSPNSSSRDEFDANWRQQAEKKLLAAKMTLNEIFPDQVRIVFGSVKTEQGLFSLMGAILELTRITTEASHINSLREDLNSESNTVEQSDEYHETDDEQIIVERMQVNSADTYDVKFKVQK